MTAATRSLATALWGARFASGLLRPSCTTTRGTSEGGFSASYVREFKRYLESKPRYW